MAHRIVTKNKKDIQYAGFDITCNVDMYQGVKTVVAPVIENASGLQYPDELWHQMAENACQQVIPQLEDIIDKAEEIFIEEASVSRWSGNMMDNSICGVSGKMPTINGEKVEMDIRVGVNTKEIQNKANWDSHRNKYYGKSKYFVHPIIYTYNGYRMKPGHDYSGYLNSGLARAAGIKVSPRWKDFVKRAEERVSAL